MAMDFEQVLKNGCICLHLEGHNKREIITELIDRMDAAGLLPDRDAALAAVIERERKMSTGMQFGIAVPHGKTPTVDGLVTAFAVKKEGVDFGSVDGQPARIFIMTVSSTYRTGPHIQYLAQVGRLLNKAGIRQKILAAETTEDIIAALTNGSTP